MRHLWLSFLAWGCSVENKLVESVEFDPAVRQCLADVAELFADDPGQFCLYFDGGQCVRSGPLALDCPQGPCPVQTVCPDDAPFLPIKKGAPLNARLYLLAQGQCPAVEPIDKKCNGSIDPRLRAQPAPDELEGCIGVVRTQFIVAASGELVVSPDFAATLSHSGFLQLEAGQWSLKGPVCSPQTGITSGCDPAITSCIQAEFIIEKEGLAPGVLSYQVDRLGAYSCNNGQFKAELPTGLLVDIDIQAQGRGVIARVESADQTCDHQFYTDTATVTHFTCTATVGRTNPIVATFGYPLTIRVEGQGTVSRMPQHGSSVCAANSVCRDIYENGEQITLTPMPGPWAFLGWQGCEGAQGPCTVTMTEPRVVQAFFGQGVEITADLPGTVVITSSTEETAECDFRAMRTCSRVFNAPASGTPRLTLQPTGTGEGPAAAQVGTVFRAWKNCTSTNGSECVVELPANNPFIQVGLSFANEVQVSVLPVEATRNPAATVRLPMGAQACVPAATNCKAFPAGGVGTLEAVGTTDWAHLTWSGSCQGQPASCGWRGAGPEALTVEFGRPIEMEVFGAGGVGAQAVRAGSAPVNLFDCRAGMPCAAVVPHGWSLELVASPDNGYEVMRWQSSTPMFCEPQEPQPRRTCGLDKLNSRQLFAAHFGRQLTVQVGLEGATVDASTRLPANNLGACGRNGAGPTGDCIGIFENNAAISLTQVVPPNWAVRWQGDCAADPCVVTLDGPKTVILNPGRTVTPAVGAGTGTVNVENCPAPCIVDDGASVTINAMPATGWDIMGWVGCTPVANNFAQCTLTANGVHTPQVFFGRPLALSLGPAGTTQVTTNAGGGAREINCGNGATPCTGVYANNSTVNLGISNLPADHTVVWGGDATCPTGALSCPVSMSQARNVSATVVPIRILTLTIGTGVGARSVAVTPTLNGTTTCTEATSPCALRYAAGTTVNLNPVANFRDWGGNPPGTCANTADPCTFVINANTSATAHFLDACQLALGVSCAAFEEGYLKASNTDADDYFGWSIALSGDGNTLAVGAYHEASGAVGVNGNQANNSVQGSGAVYVFGRNGSSWSQQTYLKASNPDMDDNFGWSLALSNDGNTLVVGAPAEDGDAMGVGGIQGNNNYFANSGAVYVFGRNGTIWTQQTYIKASNTGEDDHFGVSLALNDSGDTLAVGARSEDSGATGIGGNQSDNSAPDSGAVYLFTRNNGIWTQQSYLKASNSGAGDQFGYSIALSSDGNTLAIGGIDEDSNATGVNGDQANNSASSSGAVYVFRRSGGTWTQQAYLKASNTDADDWFGSSVTLSGDGNVLAIGANTEDSNATGVGGNQNNNLARFSGAVYIFRRTADIWVQESYLKASNTGADDRFGWSVVLSQSGDMLFIGAIGEDSGATGISSNHADNSAPNSGAVYLFRRSGSGWSQYAYLKAPNTGAEDQVGFTIAMSRNGTTLAVGAPLEDSSATGVNGNQADNSAFQSGAVYVRRVAP